MSENIHIKLKISDLSNLLQNDNYIDNDGLTYYCSLLEKNKLIFKVGDETYVLLEYDSDCLDLENNTLDITTIKERDKKRKELNDNDLKSIIRSNKIKNILTKTR